MASPRTRTPVKSIMEERAKEFALDDAGSPLVATPLKSPSGSPTSLLAATPVKMTPHSQTSSDTPTDDATTPLAYVRRLFDSEENDRDVSVPSVGTSNALHTRTPASPEKRKRGRLLFEDFAFNAGEAARDDRRGGRQEVPLTSENADQFAQTADLLRRPADDGRARQSPLLPSAAGAAAVRRWQSREQMEPNVARFTAEFDLEASVGEGEFGVVYRCRNRLDGCVYAVKRSKSRITMASKAALREVYAHATLTRMGAHENVVRYYSVWREDDYLYIQNEYCNGGCLDVRNEYTELELRDVLAHVAQGLTFVHEHKLVHLDIKPGNIFVCIVEEDEIPDALKSNRPPASHRSQSEPLLVQDAPSDAAGSLVAAKGRIYKIGDLGHVTSAEKPRVQDGDARYMAPELLRDDYRDLQRADVYSLGMSIYELARHRPLPVNGEEWQALRAGDVPRLENFSTELNDLLQAMLAVDPAQRPTAREVVARISGKRDEIETLKRELREEKFKRSSLETQLKQKENDKDRSPPKRKLQRINTAVF